MDTRRILSRGSVLPFEGMNAVVESVIGRGSNAIVYKGFYFDVSDAERRHHVLIKELFPYHPKGAIRRNDDGSIAVDEEAQDDFALHRRSFERGNRVHLDLLSKNPDAVGANLNTYSLNGTLYTVLGYTGGRSLDKVFLEEGGKGSLKSCAVRMLKILDALEAFHAEGLLHLDISPDNILVIGEGRKERIMLIDFNSVHTVGEVISGKGEYLSLKDGYTAPEIVNRSLHAVSEKTDLYSLAAVFFRMLSGRALTLSDMLKRTPPDAQDSPFVKRAPETAKSMVKTILRRALSVVPARRYGSIPEMREAFEELIDRIDGVGVTHGAIWESGKKSVERLIKTNPFYQYIASGDTVYPMRVQSGNSGMSVEEMVESIVSPEGKSALLLADGGMGKTTALLKTALQAGGAYQSAVCAYVYVPLYGYREGDGNYIRNHLLSGLRFSSDSASYEDAAHRLNALLSEPIAAKDGARPKVLLLLDGYNEISGDPTMLAEEIRRFEAMEGVRILLTSRTQPEGLALQEFRLCALDEETVKRALSENGLLLPEKEEMRRLLTTPLVLNMFLEASGDEGQLRVETEEQLIRAYLERLVQKEVSLLPEDSDERWQIEAAVWFVLAYIAGEMKKKNGAAGDYEILKIVKKCRRFLKSANMARAFPEWIGHTAQILAGSSNAEEWHGRIVQSILWKRLGMLVRGGDKQYRASHQIILEYLAGVDRANRRRLMRRRAIAASVMGACLIAGVCALHYVWKEYVRPVPYNSEMAEKALDYSSVGYSKFGRMYETVRDVIEAAQNGKEGDFSLQNTYCILALQEMSAVSRTTDIYIRFIQAMMETEGEVIEHSGEPFNGMLACELIRRHQERAAFYEEERILLTYWMENETARERYGNYPALLRNVLEADADVCAAMYELVCGPHMEGDDETWSDQRNKLVAMTGDVNRRAMAKQADLQDLEILRNTLIDAEAELKGVSAQIQRMKKFEGVK